MNNFLQTLQQRLAQTIRHLPAFKNVPILVRESSNWKNSLVESIKTAYNLSIIILPPSPYRIQKGVPGFACEQILVRIEITEPFFNHPPSPLPVAETLAAALNRREIKIDDWSGCLELTSPLPWKEIHDPLRPHRFIIELQFSLTGLLPLMI